jgi:phenylpropionate dioxygenase-like ring-hydroxylating dioxygenase large terminal subunit
VPVELFVSEEYCARERTLLWPHVWLMVGRVEDIAKPGDYLIKEIPLNRVFLIVVRGRDDVVRTFHNVCPHRGSQLLWECNGSTGKTNAFRCPYHAFTFDLTGKLKWVPDDANFYELDRDRLGLVEVRTDIWAGSYLSIWLPTRARRCWNTWVRSENAWPIFRSREKRTITNTKLSWAVTGRS